MRDKEGYIDWDVVWLKAALNVIPQAREEAQRLCGVTDDHRAKYAADETVRYSNALVKRLKEEYNKWTTLK